MSTNDWSKAVSAHRGVEGGAPRLGRAARGLVFEEPLLFARSTPGRVGHSLPPCDVGEEEAGPVEIPDALRRKDIAGFPELSEPEVMRHFVRLSQWNYSIDSGFYPLGSCTMKYNPKINEAAARVEGMALFHPLQPDDEIQGALQLMHELQEDLAEISGMDAVSLQPAAGAQGELAGVMTIRAFHRARGEQRTKILIPESAHGTNPASAALCGYEVVALPAGEDGLLQPDVVRAAMGPDVAGLMITNPNTLGLFESHIEEIAEVVHTGGGFVYMDGANLNAVLGVTRPGDQGVDVMHFNLHKTFSTPHGGGGPGAGPIGVKAALAPFLPRPRVKKDGERYALDWDQPLSIGRVRSFLGNFGMFVRAWVYIREHGPAGLARISEMAVLNANYLRARLREHWNVACDRLCMHEVILNDKGLKEHGVKTLDVAKRLIDYGYHPPTVYFPLVVDGAIMIEPTESETVTTMDEFVDALLRIRDEAQTQPDLLHQAPHAAFRRRLDEVAAVKKLDLRWKG
jgi:glycine dehydrogenase subunit 2